MVFVLQGRIQAWFYSDWVLTEQPLSCQKWLLELFETWVQTKNATEACVVRIQAWFYSDWALTEQPLSCQKWLLELFETCGSKQRMPLKHV